MAIEVVGLIKNQARLARKKTIGLGLACSQETRDWLDRLAGWADTLSIENALPIPPAIGIGFAEGLNK